MKTWRSVDRSGGLGAAWSGGLGAACPLPSRGGFSMAARPGKLVRGRTSLQSDPSTGSMEDSTSLGSHHPRRAEQHLAFSMRGSGDKKRPHDNNQ